MSKQPLGKTLLRNVIRHTDAHNKIQEEIEMWKMRDWEIQTSHNKHLSDTECVRGHMHCDRVSDQPRGLSRSTLSLRPESMRVSEHDDREARHWTRKLYEFKANDPDRWGHSGFKELYPEEFESDNEKSSATKKMGRHKKSKSDIEASLSKHSKKSSRKKKKKKKKKEEEEKQKKAKCSSSDDSSDDSSEDSAATKEKQRRKRTKSRHRNSKKRGRNEDSSSGSSEDETQKERRTHRRKKRKQDSHRDSDSGPDSKKKRRKDWKAAGGESSGDTSTD